MAIWDDIIEVGATIVGGIVGGVSGGPAGAIAGATTGSALGGWITGSGDSVSDVVQTEAAQSGLSAPPGSQIGLPGAIGGGLEGPVYRTQGGDLVSTQAGSVAKALLNALLANPEAGKILQRLWNFAASKPERDPNSMAMWIALARQVPKSHREALEQFLAGFPAPVGLNKAASDVFLTLMIAESGYNGDQLCCVENR